MKNRLFPILKYAGGKEKELKYIHPCLPKKINNYYEPFIGGGAVYFSVDANKMFINDKSHELINLYNVIAIQDKDFFSIVEEMMFNWKLLEDIINEEKTIFIKTYREFQKNYINEEQVKNLILLFITRNQKKINNMFEINVENFFKEIERNINNKIKRMKKIELDKGELSDNDIVNNIESAFKSAFYMQMRHLYNNIEKYNIKHSFTVAIFFFIRNFSYSGMFRYNKEGDFNVPYGGIGYNRKNLLKKVDYFKTNKLIEHLNKTVIDNLDFEEFFKKNKPKKDDFIFLDPPYDSEFSTYAQNEFVRNDQIRLANYLINDCEANWMLVIKNTDFIYNLYNKEGIYITSFDKKYLVNFKNRNDKKVEHLLILNYKIK